MRIVNPSEWSRPRGFSHGVVAPPGTRVLSVAGQTAADDHGDVADLDFVSQFAVSLARVLHVIGSAGGHATDIARMTIYVTDLEAYRASRAALSDVWKRQMGAHYPAMALVQVAGLVDRGATVEIQADAFLS